MGDAFSDTVEQAEYFNVPGLQTGAANGVTLPTKNGCGGQGSETVVDIADNLRRRSIATIEKHGVVMVIPAKLEMTYEELMEALDVTGLNQANSLLWPPIDKISALQEDYLPHMMLDIVEYIRKDDADKLAKLLLLQDFTIDKYEYLKLHLGGTDITHTMFSKIKDILTALTDDSVGNRVKLVDTGRLKLLVIRFLVSMPSYDEIRRALPVPLHTWDDTTPLRSMFRKPSNVEVEFERLRQWLMSHIRSGFKIASIPNKKSDLPEIRILQGSQFGSKVAGKFIAGLRGLQGQRNKSKDTKVAILVIHGVDRNVLKYKVFVKGIIKSYAQVRKHQEIFFVVCLDEADHVTAVSDIVSSEIIPRAHLFTAFHPDEAGSTCMLIHVCRKEKMPAATTEQYNRIQQLQ